ncbi:MAG: hypothetical protein KA998_05435, partial [Rickettsiaceae bacterium]|nr:hypothetical protein [Rickettsiaceae bacterium]
PITRTIFPSSIREKSVYHIYRKQKVNIQTGGQECGVFAIQDLDILNNMSIPEKKRIGNNDELDPRFFKMTQSLSSLPESHRNKIITKPTKPAKNLGEHLEQGTIKIIDTKTGEEKLQHRFFDKKYYKYLQKAKEILDNKNDAEIAAIIARRSNYSEEFNAYITPDYKPLNEQSRQEAINKITDSSNGLEIGDVIRSFSPEDRMNLEINDLLNSKISEIANNDSNNNNKGAEINHIITAFPEDVRSIFRDVAISSAKKLPIDDAVKIMESFSVNDRSFFIPTMQSLFEKESSLKNVKEIISCFNEKDRNQLLVPIKNLLSTISKPEGLRGIIQWDSSLVEDVQVPLSKAITSTDSKMSSVTIFSMIKASPENQRYHFIDNIKLYVGGIDDLDVKADELVFLANTLAPGAKRAFHDDVENLVRGGVSNKIVKRLKNSFKEFDFVKLEVDEKRESLSKSETKAITPTPPPHVVTPAKPPSPPGFSR